jgi:hypothetical protein
MTPTDAGGFAAADEPLDDLDLALLDSVRDLYQEVDPMPADLPERIRFSLALRGLEIEVARLTAEDNLPVLATRAVEQSRTVTFDSDSLTIMIRIDSNTDGTARIDGWLAPSQCREIEMRTTADSLSVVSDEHGRFSFASVPRGIVQLVVQPAEQGPGGSGQSVVTPALMV